MKSRIVMLGQMWLQGSCDINSMAQRYDTVCVCEHYRVNLGNLKD